MPVDYLRGKINTLEALPVLAKTILHESGRTKKTGLLAQPRWKGKLIRITSPFPSRRRTADCSEHRRRTAPCPCEAQSGLA